MRLYLSWIEDSATNRGVGGSNPSRRAKMETSVFIRVFLFVILRGDSNPERAANVKKICRWHIFREAVAQTGTVSKAHGRQAGKAARPTVSLKARQNGNIRIYTGVFICYLKRDYAIYNTASGLIIECYFIQSVFMQKILAIEGFLWYNILE